MNIEEFLQQEYIQEALHNSNLDYVYSKLSEFDRHELTEFLYTECDTNPLDYLTSIPDYYAYKYSGLTTVTIPKGMTSIGEGAFLNCSKLKNITIPYGVTSIDVYTFSNCLSLTGVTIPDSVTSIEYSAFSGCSNLTNITISDSVTYIGEDVFIGCPKLTIVCKENSTAHKYAIENNIKYDLIG